MKTITREDPLEALVKENTMLREEVQVARRASEITANLVVEQFVKMEDILKRLEENVAREQQLSEDLAEQLRKAEIREQQLAEARAAAESSNQAKSTFLANMSHELRTPLNAVIGYSEMLIEDAEDQGQTDLVPDLNRINAAGKHLLTLINDILDLSKIEAGKMDIHLETFDIPRMIDEVANTIQPLVETNGNTMVVDCGDDVGAVYSDLTKVRQTLFNLLSNACKFTKKGSISLKVKKEAWDNGLWYTFRVIDTGIGMTSDQMEKIFEAFLQADSSTTRDFGGTGLGLTISKRLCEMMGGTLDVESEVGVGSTFTLRLPIKSTQEESLPIPQSAPQAPTAESAAAQSRCVLVIDDDPIVLDLMKRTLTKEGFQVRTAPSGAEGLRLAREINPEVITLDVLMPGMDGWAVLSKLKEEPKLADIPVIMLTILNDTSMGYALGASDYLTKPFNRSQLVAILKKYQGSASTRRSLVVDDDPGARRLLRQMMEREGWQVSEAEDGREALVSLEEQQPLVILLDLMMPVMDGFEFVAQLRKHEKWHSLPVVVVTAKELSEKDRAWLNGNVEKIVQKGAYSRDELLGEVRELVAAHQKHQYS